MSAEGGVDVIAYRDERGFEPLLFKVWVKSAEGFWGPQVSALCNKVDSEEFGLVVSLSCFAKQA